MSDGVYLDEAAVMRAADQIQQAGNIVSLRNLSRATGLTTRLVARIRAGLRLRRLWRWEVPAPGWSAPRTLRRDAGPREPLRRQAVEGRAGEIRRAKVGHLRTDPRDDGRRGVVLRDGFGHAPPILGGPPAPDQACRAMLAEWKQLRRKNAQTQVA